MKEEGLTVTKGESQRDQAWATSDLGGWGCDSREDGRRCEEGSGGGEGGEGALGKDKQHSTDRNKSREEPGKGSLPKRAHLIQEPRAATEQK